MLPVTLIAAVWSSSMGMLAVIKGLDQIYQVPETRGYVRLRIVAVVYVILFAAVLIVAAALLVFGTTIYRFLLDHSPLLAAAALPLSQSSAMQAAQAITSQPSQPNAAVKAPQAAAITALTHRKTVVVFMVYSFPFTLPARCPWHLRRTACPTRPWHRPG